MRTTLLLLTMHLCVEAFDLSWIGFERIDRTHEDNDATETLLDNYYEYLAELAKNRTDPNTYVSTSCY